MAVRDILRMGDPRLLEVARPVRETDWPTLPALVADMEDTMADAEGTGLAAPQIGVPLRLVIFEVDGARGTPPEVSIPRTVLINPVIKVIDTALQREIEGCLSVPGMRGWVERYRVISYRGLDLNGDSIERTACGFHAVVVQHEIDHLDGVLYPMRIKDPRLFGFSEEILAAVAGDLVNDRCR